MNPAPDGWALTGYSRTALGRQEDFITLQFDIVTSDQDAVPVEVVPVDLVADLRAWTGQSKFRPHWLIESATLAPYANPSFTVMLARIEPVTEYRPESHIYLGRLINQIFPEETS
jgi:hypothetical protein